MTEPKPTSAFSALGLLVGRTYTADGREWTVDRLVLPWADDYPEHAAGRVCVQDRANGGPVVLASEVMQ